MLHLLSQPHLWQSHRPQRHWSRHHGSAVQSTSIMGRHYNLQCLQQQHCLYQTRFQSHHSRTLPSLIIKDLSRRLHYWRHLPYCPFASVVSGFSFLSEHLSSNRAPFVATSSVAESAIGASSVAESSAAASLAAAPLVTVLQFTAPSQELHLY